MAVRWCPWLVIKAVSTGGPSVRLLEPSWWEVNPRNTSVLGGECVLVDVNRQDEGKSAHLCLWFNVNLPASSFSSSSLVTPATPPPLSVSLSLSFSHSLFWRSLLANNELFLVLTNNKPNDQIYVVARIFCCTFQCWRSCCEAVDAALYPTRFCLTRFSSQRNAVPPLFCSLLFPPLFLLTLTTGRRVLVCSCCFFDIFTPSPRHVAEEWGLEMKQVWLTSWNRRGWRSS